MIDYTAVLADAVRKYQALALVVEGLTRLIDAPPVPAAEARAPAVLTTVARRALKSGRKPQRAAAKVHRTPARSAAKVKPAPGKHSRRGIPVPPEVKAIVAKEGIAAAARASGMSPKTLWGRARREGWKVGRSPRGPAPKASPGPAASKPNTKPKGEKVPMRRCDSCQMATERDPCSLCGTKWKRTEG